MVPRYMFEIDNGNFFVDEIEPRSFVAINFLSIKEDIFWEFDSLGWYQ